MKIKIITAIDLNSGIGKNNDLPWNLPADMQFFKEQTQNQIVVMGRKNYDSLPNNYKPLPNRINVVLTRNKNFHAENVLIFNDFDKAISSIKNEYKNQNKDIFIIGGAQLYQEALNSKIVDEMYITLIQHQFEVDTFFPTFNESDWKVEVMKTYLVDQKNKYPFVIKKYTKK
ncbi:MAG: dihydrofolate reductase [Flavobacteriia bacterium]|nr:dihydrofolate reductase [Flavobacteriia bacterium]